jgi:hypothetical protein
VSRVVCAGEEWWWWWIVVSTPVNPPPSLMEVATWWPRRSVVGFPALRPCCVLGAAKGSAAPCCALAATELVNGWVGACVAGRWRWEGWGWQRRGRLWPCAPSPPSVGFLSLPPPPFQPPFPAVCCVTPYTFVAYQAVRTMRLPQRVLRQAVQAVAVS